MPAKSDTSSLSLDVSYTPSHKYFTRLQEKRQIFTPKTLKRQNVNVQKYNCDVSMDLQSENSQFLDNSYELEQSNKELIMCNYENAFTVLRTPKKDYSFWKLLFIAIAVASLGFFYLQTIKIFNNVKENFDNIKQLQTKIELIIEDLNQPVFKSKCKKENPIIDNVLTNVINTYNADKTGLVDYALITAGGRILNVKDTENYVNQNNVLYRTFVDNTWPHSPSMMITPSNNPGDCWAFKGSFGTAVIELYNYIFITGVTLEHIPKTISPSQKISSAPKDFSITGILDGNLPKEYFGSFKYDDNGSALQYFSIERKSVPFKIIEFNVHSNHGHQNFTCIYRLRVHGDLADTKHALL